MNEKLLAPFSPEDVKKAFLLGTSKLQAQMGFMRFFIRNFGISVERK
jgi:hypothetical protein